VFELPLVLIGTDYICSCKSNYDMNVKGHEIQRLNEKGQKDAQ
jgi:hypothetical protein